MKKVLLAVAALLAFNASQAQVEKSITGLQLGLFGVDLNNETRLSEQVALRSAVGLNVGVWGGNFYDKTGFILYPKLSLQPKYYYNILSRKEQGKNVKNNSANYLSLQVNYTPDWFSISNYDNLRLINKLDIVPTFGIRRNFAQDFNYEFRVGLGYGTTFGEKNNVSGTVLDLGFKVGYDF
ncbi:hypothetical protein [Ornithobacterium rhinotracheale]|uniref:hypothetical protein n=1 Tax=Ornithobacterium rhinotracheale TaxID=28251 RepID=UPI001FF5E030|nr:hypothetical protein [Ornithobacterium rhinotracheale]MCK0206124.1 hypothetical protein [Ornithobacterium rhinotracheale]